MLSSFLSIIFNDDAKYEISELPQDASERKYFRVLKGLDRFILKQYNPQNYNPNDFIKIKTGKTSAVSYMLKI